MKYYLFLPFVYFLNCSNISAAIITNDPDSSITVTDYKHSHQFFLDKYGTDDTTKALINYFFRERKNAFYETVLPVVAVGVSALLLNALGNVNIKEDTGGAGLLVALPLAVVIFEAPVYFIDGQIRWLRFSRKRLLSFLTSYNFGNSLTHRITRRKVFKSELAKLK